MSTVVQLRKQLMEGAAVVIEDYLKEARGEGSNPRASPKAQQKIWDAIVPIIQATDDPTPMPRIKDKTISGRVDAILNQVASGKLTPREAKQHMALLQAGFEIQELPKLMAALEEMES